MDRLETVDQLQEVLAKTMLRNEAVKGCRAQGIADLKIAIDLPMGLCKIIETEYGTLARVGSLIIMTVAYYQLCYQFNFISIRLWG